MHESIEEYLTGFSIRIAQLEHEQKITAEIVKLYPNIRRGKYGFVDSSIVPDDVIDKWDCDFSDSSSDDKVLFVPFLKTKFGNIYSDQEFIYAFNYVDNNDKPDNSSFFEQLKKANLAQNIIDKIKNEIKEEDLSQLDYKLEQEMATKENDVQQQDPKPL